MAFVGITQDWFDNVSEQIRRFQEFLASDNAKVKTLTLANGVTIGPNASDNTILEIKVPTGGSIKLYVNSVLQGTWDATGVSAEPGA